MAKCNIDHVDDPKRPPALRRTLMIDNYRGQLRLRKWPEPRGKNRPAVNKCWTEWLREAMILYRHADPQLVQKYRDYTCGLPIKVSDPFIANTRGSFMAIPIQNGLYMYPRQAVRKVSSGLDVIGQLPGTILVRGPNMWIPLLPGPAGSVLTSMGPNQVPVWSTNGRAGNTPPTPDTLPVEVNTSQLILEQSPDGPLVFHLPQAATTANIAARMTPYPTPPMSVTTAVTATLQTLADHKFGLAVWEQTTNRFVTWTWGNRRATSRTNLEAIYWPSPTSSGNAQSFTAFSANAPIWLRLTDNGATFTLEYSLDRAAWKIYTVLPRNEYISNPTHIGIAIISDNSGSRGPSGSVHHWEVETL